MGISSVLPNFTFELFLKMPKCFLQKYCREILTFSSEIILVLALFYSFFIVKEKARKHQWRKASQNKTLMRKKFQLPGCSFKEEFQSVIFTLNFIVSTKLKHFPFPFCSTLHFHGQWHKQHVCLTCNFCPPLESANLVNYSRTKQWICPSCNEMYPWYLQSVIVIKEWGILMQD